MNSRPSTHVHCRVCSERVQVTLIVRCRLTPRISQVACFIYHSSICRPSHGVLSLSSNSHRQVAASSLQCELSPYSPLQPSSPTPSVPRLRTPMPTATSPAMSAATTPSGKSSWMRSTQRSIASAAARRPRSSTRPCRSRHRTTGPAALPSPPACRRTVASSPQPTPCSPRPGHGTAAPASRR
jgi:hypothetical protein